MVRSVFKHERGAKIYRGTIRSSKGQWNVNSERFGERRKGVLLTISRASLWTVTDLEAIMRGPWCFVCVSVTCHTHLFPFEPRERKAAYHLLLPFLL